MSSVTCPQVIKDFIYVAYLCIILSEFTLTEALSSHHHGENHRTCFHTGMSQHLCSYRDGCVVDIYHTGMYGDEVSN